jgi:hypothetical protein
MEQNTNPSARREWNENYHFIPLQVANGLVLRGLANEHAPRPAMSLAQQATKRAMPSPLHTMAMLVRMARPTD